MFTRTAVLIFVLLLSSVAGAGNLKVERPWGARCWIEKDDGVRHCRVSMAVRSNLYPEGEMIVSTIFAPDAHFSVTFLPRGALGRNDSGYLRRIDVRVDNLKTRKLTQCAMWSCFSLHLDNATFVSEMMAGKNMWIRAYPKDFDVAVDIQISLTGFVEQVEKSKSLPAK